MRPTEYAYTEFTVPRLQRLGNAYDKHAADRPQSPEEAAARNRVHQAHMMLRLYRV